MSFLHVSLGGLAHGFLHEAHEGIPAGGEEEVEVFCSQGRRIDQMGAHDSVERRGVDACLLLDGCEVFGWSHAADDAVGLCSERCFVDDALASFIVDVVVVAPLLREDVVDVDGKARILCPIEGLVEPPVARFSASIPRTSA